MSGAGRVEQLRWALYVSSLSDSATQDLDSIKDQIENSARELGAKSQSQREFIARSQITRARLRLGAAYKQRAVIRSFLLLDEDSDGQP